MIKKTFSLFLIGLGVVVCSAITLQAATELARINSKVITLEEFNKKYQENLKFFPLKPPSKKAVLDDLIKRELGIQEAKKAGLDRDPEIIDRMNTVLYHALLDKHLGKELTALNVSDAEAKSFYQKNPEIRTSHIFIPVAPNAKAEDEKKALERMRQVQQILKKGEMGFAEVAQKYSEGPAAPMGGDLDYQTRDKVPEAYYAAARRLSVGKVSDIVRTEYGFHIIKLTAVKSWDDADKALVKRQLLEERRNKLFERYMSQLRAKAKVSVRSELLKE